MPSAGTEDVIHRLARAEDTLRVPEAVPDQPGRFIVDATWGTVNPLQLAPGVRTVGELEVIEHIRRGRPVIDTRQEHFHRAATIPTARGIPHIEVRERIGELDRDQDTALFCNGPQCSATPQAIRALLDAGYPPERILYYRGGIHDWVTLGFPVVARR